MLCLLQTRARRALWLGLPLGLLALAPACNRKPTSVPYAEVSGTVTLKGNPLPGGRVTFVAVNGGFATSGDIGEDGKYKVNAPTGAVQIGVDNSFLGGGGRRGGGPPAKRPIAKRPDETETPHEIKGKYVPIPEKYKDPTQSGLTYTVKPEPQTFDIKLE